MIEELNSIGLTDRHKRVYQQPNGKIKSSEKPDTEESRRFWSNIWGTGKSDNRNIE